MENERDDWREDGQAAHELELQQQEQEECDKVNRSTNDTFNQHRQEI